MTVRVVRPSAEGYALPARDLAERAGRSGGRGGAGRGTFWAMRVVRSSVRVRVFTPRFRGENADASVFRPSRLASKLLQQPLVDSIFDRILTRVGGSGQNETLAAENDENA